MYPSGKLTKILSHPNSLTLYRALSVPAVVVLLLFPNRMCTFIAAMVFSAAAITDYLDGYLARRRGLVTTFGKVMDPVADKLLVSSAFIMLASLGWVPAWMVCIIIGRELAVTGLRNIIAEKKEDVSASNLGKYKTGFQIAAIIPLLIHYPYFGIDLHAIGTFFLWGALVFTIWSGVDYFIRFRNLLEM
ncbi:CDP-diacylglycerol--glycerol-3-phosphate 3-phosphatidyltransferase [Desulfobacteraceae bacterium SEEP-SAG9]|nr:CDP-diacylglycerol--glycerol-3-phosphate 3-phosphatidyltransferase [Desulfobacteraceae bacterium SEEP-SAG9]